MTLWRLCRRQLWLAEPPRSPALARLEPRRVLRAVPRAAASTVRSAAARSNSRANTTFTTMPRLVAEEGAGGSRSIVLAAKKQRVHPKTRFAEALPHSAHAAAGRGARRSWNRSHVCPAKGGGEQLSPRPPGLATCHASNGCVRLRGQTVAGRRRSAGNHPLRARPRPPFS